MQMHASHSGIMRLLVVCEEGNGKRTCSCTTGLTKLTTDIATEHVSDSKKKIRSILFGDCSIRFSGRRSLAWI